METLAAIVAGGAGFIGSHLCRRLLDQGKRVIAVDNLSTGSLDNLSAIASSRNFDFIRYDITEPLDMDLKVHEIYNLACAASPLHYQAQPVRTLLTSVLGSYRLLELARHKRARILLASTSEVYGDPLVNPQKEGYWGNVNPAGIRSCYDEGKRSAESLFCDYARQYGTDTRIVRIFNTYGPHMASGDGRVIPNFITQALNGFPLTVNGDGSQTRSFMYIDDLIEGIARTMDADLTAIPINLGNPGEITINQLAHTIIRLTGSRSEIVYNPLPQDDPRRRCPDITRATSLLNAWTPCVTLEKGLNLTINYFKDLTLKHNHATHAINARSIPNHAGV